MADLADLYPGCASPHWIDTSIGRIFAPVGYPIQPDRIMV